VTGESWLLCLGSKRQSGELAGVARHYGMAVRHVGESAEGLARPAAEVVADCRALIRTHTPPVAVIGLGRATVVGGIERVAQAVLALTADAPGAVLVSPSPHAARVWGDKALIAESLTRLGIPVPATRRISAASAAQIARDMREGRFPVPAIVKVTNLTGGAGMRYVANPDDLAGAVAELGGNRRELIVTEFIEGDEISVDVLRLGSQTLLFPPGVKRVTDRELTHADHKIKVNGLFGVPPALARDAKRIAASFGLSGFFSLEGIVTRRRPVAWTVLEGATRVTNNKQMQDVSLGRDAFTYLCRYLRKEPWVPEPGPLALALSIPVYRHRGAESLAAVAGLGWVRQAKLENLAEMPLTRDHRTRLTLKIDGSAQLAGRLSLLAGATGDDGLPSRVQAEVSRVRDLYGESDGSLA
jgi:phosphoribosylaminoimidazole carboxylase (NCAIR synthetase)